ncbi:tetratricopeptide repeat protein [Clostridium felsineum]|uniref:tetratricopeptide repeat protein n=1 Tax=Clostridium felsineum TaxID=36839 RepID=UPI00098C420D|nr:tetratricopeptide repeat protein [Clostridium felsineum]URZ03940.1 Beta-barrel assembly-enhancing protease [Clostridium felsineum]
MEHQEISRSQELNNRGLIFIERNQGEEALKYFNKAIEEDENFKEAYLNKADLCLAMNKINEAMNCYNKLILKYPNEKTAYFGKGNILFFYKDNIKGAIELYNKAIYLGEKNEGVYCNLGLCMEALGELEEAIKWFDRAIIANSQNTRIMNKRAALLVKLRRFDEAIECYDKVLKIEVDNEEAYHFKAVLLGELGKIEEALETIAAAEALLGEQMTLDYDKAILFEKQKNFEKALECVDKSLVFDEANVLLILKKGQLLTYLKKTDEAKLVYDQISEFHPNNMEGKFAKANICMLLGEYEDTENLFKEIIYKLEDEDPILIKLYYYRALNLKRLGRLEEAEAAYREAIKKYNFLIIKYPYDDKLNFLKANCLRDMGEYERAEELYEYIIDLDGNFVDAYLMRARNRISLNRYKEAREDLNEVIKINPAYRDLIELDEQFKELLNTKDESYR